MNARLAIGLGCRRGVEAAPVVALVREALARGDLSSENLALFTIADKRDEDGLTQAAEELGATLRFLPREMLAGVATPTNSDRVQALYGIGSVAEGAALAGAGTGATLVVARLARNGVTCAIARRAA